MKHTIKIEVLKIKTSFRIFVLLEDEKIELSFNELVDYIDANRFQLCEVKTYEDNKLLLHSFLRFKERKSFEKLLLNACKAKI